MLPPPSLSVSPHRILQKLGFYGFFDVTLKNKVKHIGDMISDGMVIYYDDL